MLRARWHCFHHRGLVDDGRGERGSGEGQGVAGGGFVGEVYVHAALSEEGIEN